ncbi:MAG: D-aminoacylase [Candidatus Glassbacteria bacterium]|nr:D-aminoacylase [Candidatus Glassbacteria bacterium]
MRSKLILAGLIVLAASLAACAGKTSPKFDILITGGTVIDGTGAPRRQVDVGIIADTIAAVGDLAGAWSGRLINASGRIVAPGVIDIHGHSDYSILVDGTAQSKIRQGVTTEIIGEALSAGPISRAGQNFKRVEAPLWDADIEWSTLGEYFQVLERRGSSINIGSFVGTMSVRRYVIGDTNRNPSDVELDSMCVLVDAAMRQGALGVSSALLGSPLTTAELIAMARVASRHGGIYSTHVRDEGSLIFSSLDEAFRIGREADLPVDVIHLKVAERDLWGRMDSVLARFEQAREEGLDVTANMYPYIAGQNNLSALIPPEGQDGGRDKMLERLHDPGWRRQFKETLYAGGRPDWYNHYTSSAGWESMLVVSTKAEKNQDLIGRRMSEVIEMRGGEPTDVLFDLLLEEGGSVPTVYFLMSEEDVRTAMVHPLVSFCSDGVAVRPEGPLGKGKPHPRWYGSFPRILGRYARDQKVLSLESAVHKMTWQNAEKLGITGRGLIKVGMAADLMLFDPESVLDRATFSDPHHYPEGIEYVLVNGTVVIDKGEHTGALPGRIIYGPGRE